eukprot:TRINITY_DN12052_c0_g1_i1.p1 TRINITY_DN12052_c0_g1~~TRINITY_DN12052_c0_g1_i1.p1  ORF type:complete len:359 (+),score=58.94 TRINITY_DN12052_c0_g1_i1:40-1077(+)
MSPFGLRGQQQDVTEFAHWLLEQMGDADNRQSLVGRCFGICAETAVRCVSCGHQQAKDEAYTDLCLSLAPQASKASHADSVDEDIEMTGKDDKVPIKRSISDLLHAYLSEELLSGYRCDSCGAADTSRRRCQIKEASEHLIVTLSRFAFTADGGQQKLDAYVSVDKVLNVPMLDSRASESGTARYALYAIVNHIGSSPHSGHYICLGCSSSETSNEDASVSSSWNRYDDTSVGALPGGGTQESLDAAVNGNATAYVLMYRRLDVRDGDQSRKQAGPNLPSRLFAEAILQELKDLSSGSETSEESHSKKTFFGSGDPSGGSGASLGFEPPGGNLDRGGIGGGGWIS